MGGSGGATATFSVRDNLPQKSPHGAFSDSLTLQEWPTTEIASYFIFTNNTKYITQRKLTVQTKG